MILGADQSQNKQSVNLQPDSLESVVCSECGNETFTQMFYLKKLLALNPNNPAGRDMYVPVQSWACS